MKRHGNLGVCTRWSSALFLIALWGLQLGPVSLAVAADDAPYQPAAATADQLTLRQAAQLALENSPSLYFDREQIRTDTALLQQSAGTFDLQVSGDWKVERNLNPLSAAKVMDQRRAGSGLAKQTRDIQALADRLQADLDANTGEVITLPPCTGGQSESVVIVVDNTEERFDVCVPPESITAEEFKRKITEIIAPHLLDEAIEINRTFIQRSVDRLNRAAALLRQAQRDRGAITTYEAKTFIDLSLRTSRQRRFGLKVDTNVAFKATSDYLIGKRKASEFGGKGIRDNVVSTYELTFTLPLGKGRGGISLVAPERAAERTLNASVLRYVNTMASKAVRDVARAYWRVVAAQERVALQEKSVANAQELVDRAQQLLDAGETVRSELSQAKGRLFEAQASLEADRQALKSARHGLAVAMGLRLSAVDAAPLAAGSFPATPSPAALEPWWRLHRSGKAIERRPDVRALEEARAAAQLLANAARFDLRNRVDLQVKFQYNNVGELRFTETIVNPDDYAQAAGDASGWNTAGPSIFVNLTWDLPNNNDVAIGRWGQRRASFQRQTIELRNLKRTIAAGTESLLGSIERAIEDVRAQEEAAQHFEQTLRNELEKFSAGLTRAVDVVKTEQEQIAQLLRLVDSKENLQNLISQLRYEMAKNLAVRVDGDRVTVRELRPAGLDL